MLVFLAGKCWSKLGRLGLDFSALLQVYTFHAYRPLQLKARYENGQYGGERSQHSMTLVAVKAQQLLLTIRSQMHQRADMVPKPSKVSGKAFNTLKKRPLHWWAVSSSILTYELSLDKHDGLGSKEPHLEWISAYGRLTYSESPLRRNQLRPLNQSPA